MKYLLSGSCKNQIGIYREYFYLLTIPWFGRVSLSQKFAFDSLFPFELHSLRTHRVLPVILQFLVIIIEKKNKLNIFPNTQSSTTS